MSEIDRYPMLKYMVALVAVLATALLCQPVTAKTNVTRQGDTLVIQVPIQIVTALEDDLFIQELLDLKRDVESIWNRAFEGFRYDCWKFRFELELIHARPGGSAKEGYHVVDLWPITWKPRGVPVAGWHTHVINVPNYKFHADDSIPHRDFAFPYKGEMVGVFYTLHPTVFAHEVGHVMGLGDDYYIAGGYKPEAGGIGHTAGGVVFIAPNGDVVDSGTFMTIGSGGPEPVHLFRIVNMMKQAGVLPPCPGKLWTGTVHWTAKHTRTHHVTSRATVRLRETQITDRQIELVHEGSTVTVKHSTVGADHCSYAGGGASAAEGRAGWLVREENAGPNGELRWGPWTYQLAITPAREPIWTQTCPDVAWPGTDRTHTVTYGGNASGSWLAFIGGHHDADPIGLRLLDGGRMTGSYTSQKKNSWEDAVIWSICREDVACDPIPETASAPSTSDGGRHQAGAAPQGGGSPSASGRTAAPPAQVSPAQMPRAPRATGGGFIRP